MTFDLRKALCVAHNRIMCDPPHWMSQIMAVIASQSPLGVGFITEEHFACSISVAESLSVSVSLSGLISILISIGIWTFRCLYAVF